MLTRTGAAILFAGLGLLTSGLALGNLFYAGVSLIPFSLFLASLAVEAPHDIKATLRVSKPSPRVGEEMTIEVDYEVPKGAGGVELHVPLPETFELVSGHNLKLVAKAPRSAASGTLSFVCRAGKRGRVEIGPVRVESIHALGVRAPAKADAVAALALDVRPALAPVRRIRGLSGFARQMFPESDAAIAGIQTTDFRDIRDYHFGDPIKSINWRASARSAGFIAGTGVPLVNEYEREGKKAVWLLLDAAPYMQVGTSVDNSFETAIKAATGIAQFYLDRGYKLGAYIYNSDKKGFYYPDVGRKQMLRLQRAVTGLRPGDGDAEGLWGAVERCRRWFIQDKPLIVIVTRLGKADERTFAALKKLRGVTARRRKRIPVLFVSPVVHAHLPANEDYRADIVSVLRKRERPLIQRVRRAGARVVEWDPTQARLETVLLKGGRVR
ncbi:MAG TPA: DUF58 domain-containing protein [Candidatus Thermoplasmatota archaeon]|nr:DUF58 domain-containing protein [Candidatus Thermoplasmatota archaeon]